MGKVESMRGSVPSFTALQEAEVPVVSGKSGEIEVEVLIGGIEGGTLGVPWHGTW